MSKIITIDDEPLARSIVKEYLQKYPDLEVVQECNDGFEGFKAIQQYQPDLIFLDIQMPKINGFEMLELLDQRPAVIFTTAFDEYAIKAFETHDIFGASIQRGSECCANLQHHRHFDGYIEGRGRGYR